MTPIIHKNTRVIAPAAIVHSNPEVESKTRNVYLATSVLSSCTNTFVTILKTKRSIDRIGTKTTVALFFLSCMRMLSTLRACTA